MPSESNFPHAVTSVGPKLDRAVQAPRLHGSTNIPLECGSVALAVILILAATSLTLRFAPGAFHDDGVYIALGQSIATGHGYHSVYQIGAPVHAKYPPALPLLFALFWLVAGTVQGVVKLAFVTNLACAGAAAACLWAIARRIGLTPLLALCFATGPLLFDPAVTYLTLPISEPFFVLLWAAALLVYRFAADHPHAGSIRSNILLGALLCTACLFRTQAIVLLPAFLLALHQRGVSWRRCGWTGAVAVVPLLVWLAWHAHMLATGPVSAAPDEMPYTQWLHTGSASGLPRLLARIVFDNVESYTRDVIHLLANRTAPGVASFAIFAAAFCIGFVRAVRSEPALAYTVLATALALVTWPFSQDRLMLSLLPFASLIAGAGWAYAAGRFRRASYAVLVVLMVVVAWRQTTLRQETRQAFATGARPTYFIPDYALLYNSRFIRNVSTWLLENSPPNARVLVDFPAAVYLNSGRRTLAANPTESDYSTRHVFRRAGGYLVERLLQDSIDVVIVSGPANGMNRDVATVLRRCPGLLVRQAVHGEGVLPAIYLVQRSVLLGARVRCAAPDSP